MEIMGMALNGLHKEVERIFLRYKFKKKSKILILGSGQGAADYWLLKNGYKNITSVDLYTENKLKSKVNFKRINLNNELFYKNLNDKFDVIICIEIIEHLNNVNNFLFNISNLIKKNSKIFISTPNIHSKLSRLDSLLTGYPNYFVSKPKLGDHVSPILISVLDHFCSLNKLKIKKIFGFGSIFIYIKEYNKVSLRSYFYILYIFFLYFILYPLMLINRKNSNKIINIFVIERNQQFK